MKRRTFIRNSAVLTGSSMILPWSLSHARNANERINLAVIGCGRRGRNGLQNFFAISGDQNFRFSAVCDVDQNRAYQTRSLIENIYQENEIRQRVRVYHNYNMVFKDRDIDAVFIATPDHQHAEIAIAAASEGIDVYLEKPLTYTIQEGQELVKAVRANNRIFQTGSQQRSSIYFRKVCELVRNNKIGKVHTVEVRIPADRGTAPTDPMEIPDNLNYRAWLGNAPEAPYSEYRVHPQEDFSRPGWMQVEDYCHGMITNWGSHMFDIAQWGLGTENTGPEFVEASAKFENRGLWDVHTEMSGESRFPDGITVKLNPVLKESEEASISVKFIGEDGWATCERGAFYASDRELLRWEPGEEDISLPVSTNHQADFLNAVRTRRDPIAPVEAGHRSNTYCLLHLISAKLKRPLKWNPEKEIIEDDSEANDLLTSNIRNY